MLTLATILEKIRYATHDEQETGYTDAFLMGVINDGIRLIRRTIMEINPMILADFTQEGTLEAGKSGIVPYEVTSRKVVYTDDGEKKVIEETAPVILSHICSVRVDGKELRQIQPHEIYKLDKDGSPRAYYLTGFCNVNVFPVPNEEVPYRIDGVRDISELTNTTDVSPFPSEYDDFLYEYAIMRASFGNEFDMSQETGLVGQIISQIEERVRGISPVGVYSTGYWTPHDDRRRWSR